jgi:hypothetical protein
MKNFWTVLVTKDEKVCLENESYIGIKLYLDGKFQNLDEQILFASNLARKINGTFDDCIG